MAPLIKNKADIEKIVTKLEESMEMENLDTAQHTNALGTFFISLGNYFYDKIVETETPLPEFFDVDEHSRQN